MNSNNCERCADRQAEESEKKALAKERREQGKETALQRKADKLQAKAQKILDILAQHHVTVQDPALVTALAKA